MKKNNIFYFVALLLVIILAALAHNSSRFSIGNLFSVSLQDTNSILSSDYSLGDIEEIVYFRPLWVGRYVLHSKLIVRFQDGTSQAYSGEFLNDKFPSYARFSFIDGDITFYRFGGFRMKDIYQDQLETAEKILDRVLYEESIRKKMNINN